MLDKEDGEQLSAEVDDMVTNQNYVNDQFPEKAINDIMFSTVKKKEFVLGLHTFQCLHSFSQIVVAGKNIISHVGNNLTY